MSKNDAKNQVRSSRFRLRVFLGIGLFILVAAPALTIFIEFRQRRYREILEDQAVAAENRGDLKEALRLTTRQLEIRPGAFEPTARYSRIISQAAGTPAEREKARTFLKSILEKVPGRRVERRMAADLAIKQADYSDAIANLMPLTEGVSPAELAEIQDLIAQCYESNQKLESAAEFYEKAITNAPDRIDTYVRFANFLRIGPKNQINADDLMDRMILTNPTSAKALLERGRYRIRYKLAGSKEDILAARELAPDDPQILIASVDLMTKDWPQADVSKLRDDVVAAFTKTPENAELTAILAKLQLLDSKPEEALATLRLGLSKSSNSVILRWMLADLLLDLGRAGEAKPEIELLREAKVRSVLTDFLYARILIDEEKWGEAARALENVRPGLNEVEQFRTQVIRVDHYAALCYERLNDSEQKETVLRRALSIVPDSVSDREELARILGATGRVDEALRMYRVLLTNSPLYHAEIARLLLNNNLGLAPEKRRWKEVEKEIEETAKAAPDSVSVPLLAAQVRIAQGQPASARTILEKGREATPDRPELWLALARLSLQENKNDEASAILNEAEKRFGDRVELRIARIEWGLRQAGPEALKFLAKQEEGLEKLPRADQRKLLDALADGYFKLGSEVDSSRLLNRSKDSFPDFLPTRLTGFERAFRQKNVEEMKRSLDAIRKIEGDHGPWGDLCEIRYLMLKGDQGDSAARELARNMAASIAPSRPNWRPLARLLAEIEDRFGNRTKAVESYLKAISLGEDNPALIRRAVELLSSNRRFEEASVLIEKLRGQFESQADLRRLNEDLLLKVKGSSAALDSAKKAVAAGSKDFRDYLWLARLLLASDKKAEVEPLIRQAISMSKDQPEAWVSLIVYLVEAGRKSQAEAALVEAKAAFGAGQHVIELAYMEERVGHVKEADEAYRQALAASPDDPTILKMAAEHELRANQSKQAEPILKAMAASKTIDPLLIQWAQVNLAIILSDDGDNARCDEALSILAQLEKTNLDLQSDFAKDLERAKGIVLGRQPGRPRRKEAIRLLEQATRTPNPNPTDLLLLARLYEEANDWNSAKERLNILMSSQGKNPDYLAAFARSLLRKGDWKTARPLFERLKNLEPETLRVKEIETRLLKAEDRDSEAAAVFVSYSSGKDAKIVRMAAALLEELGMFKDSEAIYRQLASQSETSEGRLNLAMFLARCNRVEEALEVCDAERIKCTPDNISRVYMYVLTIAQATDAQRERVASWFEQVLKQTPRNAPILWRLGTIRDNQGRYAEAEENYKRAIGADSKAVIALNNLAWLLAFQSGRTQEALQLIEQAIAIEGPIPDLLDTRAVIYLAFESMPMRQKGVEDMEKAVADSPTPARLFHLSEAYNLINENQRAISTFEKANREGLSIKMLHALERPIYQKLSVELTRK